MGGFEGRRLAWALVDPGIAVVVAMVLPKMS
jgi:hypothetical protein